MRVAFYVHDARKRICGWDADLGRRRRVPGALMGYGNGLPHDLAQYVVEAATGYRNGFWGLVARGATFTSAGRKVTKPGRALIVEHRADLAESERLAGWHLGAWRAGADTPTSRALDRAREQWLALAPGERVVFDWPSPHGAVTGTAHAGITETTTTGTTGRPGGAA